ncbi:acyl-CoA dehydrogenase [Rhodococcus opacus]|uniref:acyl-CoA dehydrogenase family protein n=2 Tax=Rhodococcus opacus TaxID=37919 RepID=UPI000EA9FC18|nr:acyl-CoA dehydrogenase family protein [Rhodococcus opacus]QZS52741.1 acyl-CoA/acyl-ACP dehydrogenase [Rhodococcus opacus]RKM65260.1 acyl-CoA dehydrogenase [Rhodococcus opacus]
MNTTKLIDQALPAAMPLAPSDEETLLRSTVAGIVAKYGHEYYRKKSLTGEPMQELWDELGRQGFLGLNIPEEFGGGGVGLSHLAIVLEEMSAGGCPELAMVLSQGIAGSALTRHGTREQQERYLPGIASGEIKFAFALTEPDAGSNSHNITTTATRSDRGWRVRGAKYYISGIDHSDYFLLVARTGQDSTTGKGKVSLFVVETDIPGLTKEPIATALGAPERQFSLFFDNVELENDRLVGEVDRGLDPLFDGLNPERVLSAAISTGIARYALDKACSYVKQRTVWGNTPIGSYQAVQHPLAVAAIELEAARLMARKAAELFDAGLPAGEQANMAKYLASKAGYHSLDTAIQVHGGNGLAYEFGLADLWGIVRLQQIAPVSTEMVLNYVAQHTLDLPRSY